MSKTWRLLSTLTTIIAVVLVLAACGNGDDPLAEPEAPGVGDDAPEQPTGDPYLIGWLTDASSVTRGTYYPEYEGARLFFETLNAEGGIHGRPVELLVEDMQIDQELAVSFATRLIEDRGVLMLAGGTIEGRMPPVFEVVRANEVAFLTGHSARPDMFPPDADPLLFTVGNVFEAMSDARVDVWPAMFAERYPDGGAAACYIHEAPAAFAVCNRWLNFLEQESNWSAGPIVSAPLETSDFSSFVRPVVSEDPDAFFAISIAAHATGVAIAARDGGYTGPIVFSMTATPESDILSVIDQVGGEDIWAISNITSIYEEDVDEIQRILAAAENYGAEIAPNSATVNGWLMGMIIADALERCGPDCDRAGLRDALETTNIDTRGLTGGPFVFGDGDHVGPRYWTAYRWDVDHQRLVRVIDEWIEFRAEDLREPLGD